MGFSKSIVLLFFVCASLLAASGLSLDDIPPPPGSSLRYSQYFGKELLKAEYWILLDDNASFDERLERGRSEAQKCAAAMQAMGWLLKKENRQTRGGEFVFKKEIIKQARVTVAPGVTYLQGKKTYYIFCKFEIKRLIPFQDVPGYDYPDVPRFPGSMRIRWMDLLGDYSAKYLAAAKIEEVKKFFEKELPAYDWQPGMGAGTLNYLKGGHIARGAKGAALSIHLSEKEGIISIGIGRSAGAGGSILKTPAEITPAEKSQSAPERVLTFIDHEKDLPTYPGLKRKLAENLPINVYGQEIIRMKLETGQVEPKTALQMARFYLKEMKANDWEVKGDEWHGLGRRFEFQKGAVRVKIDIKAIGRYPIPETAAKRPINIPVQIDVILPLPLRDTAGKDIETVPRFPGSVRYYYLEAGLDHTVRYKAAARVNVVERFYIEKLPESGWTFAGCDTSGLLFVPAAAARSAVAALAKGKLIPTTLKLKVDDMGNGTVKIGLTRTRGD